MSVNSKMKAIADKIRAIRGTTGTMGLDAMATNLGTVQTNITSAFTSVGNKGGTVPTSKVIGNLASAIDSIELGVELNFEVVGGTTQPSNPTENTIWVNTSTTISSWVFSATQPTGATGKVWISIGTDSNASFNALKENGIQVYPISAKQYVSGAWVAKTAKSRQNGKWVDWINYIYNKGVTGYTFMPVAMYMDSSKDYPAAAPTVTMQADHVEISLATLPSHPRGRYGLVYITEKIDFTNANTLVLEGDFYQSFNPTRPTVKVYSNIGTYLTDNVVAEKTNIVSDAGRWETHLVEIDVSHVSNKNYIGIVMQSDSTSEVVTSYVRLRQIYLK